MYREPMNPINWYSLGQRRRQAREHRTVTVRLAWIHADHLRRYLDHALTRDDLTPTWRRRLRRLREVAAAAMADVDAEK